ncbi:MAG: hypothetical protein ACFFFB_13920 [Candidatus Heimdallarchaeota archaeon]
MNENNNNDEEHEIEKIKLRKMQAFMEAKKREEAIKNRVVTITEKIDFILRSVLAPDAYSYLSNLKEKEPMIYQQIFNHLVSPDVIQNADYLIAIIRQRGSVPRRIPLDIIIYLERKVKGIKGKIQVKKGDGEVMDLGSYLTKS